MSTLDQYKIITLKHKPNASTYPVIFVKEHKIRVKDPEKPPGRTLFLLNIPPYINENELRYCLKPFGEIESVIFADKPGKPEETESVNVTHRRMNEDKFLKSKSFNHYKVAYIVFKDTTSLEDVLEITELYLYDKENGNCQIISGIQKWSQEYMNSIVDEVTLQNEINKYMNVYDKIQHQKREAEKSGDADNDGWITVTKYNKHASFEQNDAITTKLEEKNERKKKKMELKNFYTFQIKESKMKKIIGLRKKFEEDKEKLEALKKTRRFKPF